MFGDSSKSGDRTSSFQVYFIIKETLYQLENNLNWKIQNAPGYRCWNAYNLIPLN